MHTESTPPNVFPELQSGPAAPRRQRLWRRGAARTAPSLAWYQFTFRRLLLLVLIISLPFAWLGRLQELPDLVGLRLTGTSIVDGCLKPLRRACPSVSIFTEHESHRGRIG